MTDDKSVVTGLLLNRTDDLPKGSEINFHELVQPNLNINKSATKPYLKQIKFEVNMESKIANTKDQNIVNHHPNDK